MNFVASLLCWLLSIVSVHAATLPAGALLQRGDKAPIVCRAVCPEHSMPSAPGDPGTDGCYFEEADNLELESTHSADILDLTIVHHVFDLMAFDVRKPSAWIGAPVHEGREPGAARSLALIC
jgi:hypothetical protein